MRIKNLLLLLLCIHIIFVQSGCSSQKFVQTELYFGLSQNNGNIISDSAWNTFVQDYITKTFSRGFTILSSEGKWLDEQSKQIHGEPSHVIISVNKMNKHLSQDIDSLRSAYKRLFQQESVLRVDKKTVASF
jgi:Protein of unknown function (DUF3574)